MLRLAALALTALLAACTSVSYDFGDIAPGASASPAASRSAASPHRVAVRNPRFGDRKPHPWDGRAPWTYAVHGTDVSKYQRSVNWQEAKAAGISFVFIKATEGGDMFDEFFNEHWRGAKAAGIPRSAYHFFYFCRSAREQAQWFIRNVPKEAGVLPHVLDMEWNHLSPTCRLRPPAATVQSEMRVFLDMIERHYGKRPIIYTSVDFYHDNRLHEFKGYEWWLRSVANHPDKIYNNERFLFWQYTGTGEVPGIRGDADINVFNGSEAQWQAWLRENAR
ncbi:glycoside hydrolase family 25 protein [Mesorhizobium microcysteis]|uniref:Glycoside hydrolase family 25 protein n=1 Tax=Neoaquamicrobium microcysteis TaxID=2682781 RepID=A0A5D4GVE6_9HYPH|nr:GH25 family lysozyme [Mesorhizobium microcysteis]TYR32357.1 glycoside hydrolase family 25 protein [Mesorhizobium microcysteis]